MGALADFAQGKTATQVMDGLYENHPDWDDSQETRQSVRQVLRSVNPSDARFATTKYGRAYDLARQAAVDVLQEEVRDAFKAVAASVSADLREFEVLGETVLGLLDNAVEASVTSNSEFISTLRAYTGLQKVKIEGAMALADLASRLSELAIVGKIDDEA